MSELAPRRSHTSGYYSTDDDTTVVKEHAKRLCGFSEMNCHCCGISNRRIEGLLLQCAACRQAYYCSVECFNQHLPHHAPFCRTAVLDQGPMGKRSTVSIPSSPPVVIPHQASTSTTTEATAGKLPVKTKYIDTSCSESETEPESVGRIRSTGNATRQIPKLTKSPRRYGQKRPPRPSGTTGVGGSVASNSTRSTAALQALATARSNHRTDLKSFRTNDATAVVSTNCTLNRSSAALHALTRSRNGTKSVPGKVDPRVCSSDDNTTQSNGDGDGLPRVVTPTQCYGFGNDNAQVPSENEWDEETWDDSFDGEDENHYNDEDDDADEWEEETVTTTQHDGELASTSLETTTRRSGGGTIPQWNGRSKASTVNASSRGKVTTAVTPAAIVERPIRPRVQRSFVDASCSESETETESMAAERRVSRRQRRCGKRQTLRADPVTTTMTPLESTKAFQATAMVIDRTAARGASTATGIGTTANPSDTITNNDTRNQGNCGDADDISFINAMDLDGTVNATSNAPYAQFRLDRNLNESHASLVSGAPSIALASQTDTDTLSDMDLLSFGGDAPTDCKHGVSRVLISGVNDQTIATDAAVTPVMVPERVDREIEYSQVCRGGGNLNWNDGTETQNTEVVLKPTQRVQSTVDSKNPEWIEGSLRQRGDKTCGVSNGNMKDRVYSGGRDLADGPESLCMDHSEQNTPRDSNRGNSIFGTYHECTSSPKKEVDNAINDEDTETEIEQSRFLRGGGLLNQHAARPPDGAFRFVARGESNVESEVLSQPILRQSSEVGATETKGRARLQSNDNASSHDEYEYGHELNFTTDDCISDFDDVSNSSSDFDFTDHRGPGESTWYPKQQRRHSIDSAEDIDVVISRLRYGGGYMGSPVNVRQTRRNSASVSLRPTKREKQSYPWTRPEWTSYRLRKVNVERNKSIEGVMAGSNGRQKDSSGSLIEGANLPYYGSGLSSPTQATRKKQTIEWEKPQWVESRLRSTSPERKLERTVPTPSRVDGAKPEWIQGKSGLKPTTNGRKLKRMGTFREELKRERIVMYTETNKTGRVRDTSTGNPATVPDIVKRARLPRKPKVKA